MYTANDSKKETSNNGAERKSLEKMIRKSTEHLQEKKRALDKRTGRQLGGGGRR